jgi:hypothetical protein
VHLALAPSLSIPVVVHIQSPASSNASSAVPWTESRPPLSVTLLSNQPNAMELNSSTDPHGARNGVTIQNVEPGTYSVNLMPQGSWYVQSASYGQTNVLYDDMNVTPGQAYPLEITVRNDSASITASVQTPNNQAMPVVLLIVPQPQTKSTPRKVQGMSTNLTASGLAPGDYLVYAFDRVTGLEYANPDALAPYASQATHVTLTANQQSQMTLSLIQLGQGE